MTAGDIARLAPTLSAVALAGENVKFAKKKNKSTKGFVKNATTNLVGLPLIQVQAQLAGLIN